MIIIIIIIITIMMIMIIIIFMLHVPLHITKLIDVGGVSLWVSSVCWDTK